MDSCPQCGQAVTTQDSSTSANVIALIVVLVILVIVGSFAVAPEHGMEHARTTAEAASGTPAGAPAKPAHAMENTSAAKAARGLVNAQRLVLPFKR